MPTLSAVAARRARLAAAQAEQHAHQLPPTTPTSTDVLEEQPPPQSDGVGDSHAEAIAPAKARHAVEGATEDAVVDASSSGSTDRVAPIRASRCRPATGVASPRGSRRNGVHPERRGGVETSSARQRQAKRYFVPQTSTSEHAPVARRVVVEPTAAFEADANFVSLGDFEGEDDEGEQGESESDSSEESASSESEERNASGLDSTDDSQRGDESGSDDVRRHPEVSRAQNTSGMHSEPSSSREGGPHTTRNFKPIFTSTSARVQNVLVVRKAEPARPEAEQVAEVVVGLMDGETFAFVGISSMRVLRGHVALGGATLSPSTGERLIFASRSSPLPVIEALSEDEVGALASSSRSSAGHTSIERMYAAYPAVVRFRQVDCGLEHLGTSCPVAGMQPFAALELAEGMHARFGIANFFPVLGNGPKAVRYLRLPPPWTRVLTTLAKDAEAFAGSTSRPVGPADASTDPPEPIKLLVRGPKNVGKSTFARSALHALLSSGRHDRVAFLDTDLGQAEFGPPGMVALHIFGRPGGSASREPFPLGPSWATQRHAYRAHWVGDTSPRDDPESYIAGVEACLSAFSAEVQWPPGATPPASLGSRPTPLVVNTQGWVKGLGADLLSRIEHLLCPTHIVDILPREPTVNGPAPTSRDDENTRIDGTIASEVGPPFRGAPYYGPDGAQLAPGAIVIPLEAAADAASPRRLTPSDTRTLSVLSHLYAEALPAAPSPACVAQGATVPRWTFSPTLVQRPPFVVDVATGLRGGIHVLPFGAEIPPEMGLEALNGSLCALVEVSAASLDASPADATNSGQRKDVDRDGGTSAEPMDVVRTWHRALTVSPPSPHESHCLGLAVVRSIEPERARLHVLTSRSFVSSTQGDGPRTERHLALVKGAVELPIWASLDAAHLRLYCHSLDDVGTTHQLSLVPEGPRRELHRPETLAGVPLANVPYLHFPTWPPPQAHVGSNMRASNSAAAAAAAPAPAVATGTSSGAPMSNGMGGLGVGTSANQEPLGMKRRKVRRNLQRRSQR